MKAKMAGNARLLFTTKPRITFLCSCRISYSVETAIFSNAYKPGGDKSNYLTAVTDIPQHGFTSMSLRKSRFGRSVNSTLMSNFSRILAVSSDVSISNKSCRNSTKIPSVGSCRQISFWSCLLSQKTEANHGGDGGKTAEESAEFERLIQADSIVPQSDHIKVASEILKEDMKRIDSMSQDSSSERNQGERQTNFEYDYRVAEDIEEYDYIDESALPEKVRPEKILPITLNRGENGVFELEELVTLLEHLGAENIVSFPVPHEANFCDHMVIVSAKSQRHLQALNDELLWVHKRKKSNNDPHLLIEGLNKSQWCAMDMGNIVLHIFYGDAREFYDIESLWTLGPEQDPKCQSNSIDPYALSQEDLFWLETEKSDGKATTEIKAGDSSSSLAGERESVPATSKTSRRNIKTDTGVINESDVGWGISKH